MFDSSATSQSSFDIKFDWGRTCFDAYKSNTDVFVAVDVFSFSYFVDHSDVENLSPFTKLTYLKNIKQPVLLGCLRNANAVAQRAMQLGKRVTVVALGDELGLLGFRPNFEDLMGAGAVIASLKGTKSTQAESAEDSFKYNLQDLATMLGKCAGGKLLLSHSSDDSLKFVAQVSSVESSPGLR